MTGKLSTSEAARVLGTSEARIRELVRSGLGRPARRGRRYAFSFQDLVVLRTALALIEQKVPAARVSRALAALVEELPADRPLSGLRIFADGDRVVVQEGDLRWNPETGQTVLDFDTSELAKRSEDMRTLTAAEGHLEGDARERAAVEEFDRAIDLEDEDPAAACEAYGRALELDPDLVDAYVNLGRLAHEAAHGLEAIRLYELALERTPEDPLLHYNLGLAVEDTHGAQAAEPHYERALELAPDFADAHYNLAALCEKLDQPHRALRHYHAYKRLTE